MARNPCTLACQCVHCITHPLSPSPSSIQSPPPPPPRPCHPHCYPCHPHSRPTASRDALGGASEALGVVRVEVVGPEPDRQIAYAETRASALGQSAGMCQRQGGSISSRARVIASVSVKKKSIYTDVAGVPELFRRILSKHFIPDHPPAKVIRGWY